MVLNAAVQALRQAEELKQQVQKGSSGVSILQDRSVWLTQQQLQKVYQKVLVLDLDYALDKKVEQDLWTVGFKQQIEALQAIAKDRKNPRRSEGQAMLSCVLQTAAGFYLCLLHQICTAFKLDLPFRRRASLLGEVGAWCAGDTQETPSRLGAIAAPPAPAACRYICQHCLVHLGDLARYRHQLRIADTFYRHALAVSTSSGQPYNQLALLEASRGERLAALYYHVRSVAVRAPFPPAQTNLARTLAAHHNNNITEEEMMPVLPGVSDKVSFKKRPAEEPEEIMSAHRYTTLLIRLHHLLHTAEKLDQAEQLVSTLNSALSTLVATDTFQPNTLIKMCCINAYAVYASTEGDRIPHASLAPAESRAAMLATRLAVSALPALLLPITEHTSSGRLCRSAALPAVKVLLEWLRQNPVLLRDPALINCPSLRTDLASLFNALQSEIQQFLGDKYLTVPLPEDEELRGFLPLEGAFAGLRFWDATEDVTAAPTELPRGGWGREADSEGEEEGDVEEKEQLCCRLRAYRLVRLGQWLAEVWSEAGDHSLSYEVTNSLVHFTARDIVTNGEASTSNHSDKEVVQNLSQLTLEINDSNKFAETEVKNDLDTEMVGSSTMTIPPVVISEADFREKVMEKRVGILKPQGSLERAREERALQATTTADIKVTLAPKQEVAPDTPAKEPTEIILTPRSSGRTNVALQAILRKQEEINKQVKFVTPATTPDSTPLKENVEKSPPKVESKIVQPKPLKSIANLPLGRKTGGILSLKDKSGGYPHLVNTEAESKKTEDKPAEAIGKKAEPPKFNSSSFSVLQSQNSQLSQGYGSSQPTKIIAQTPQRNERNSQRNDFNNQNSYRVNPYAPPEGVRPHFKSNTHNYAQQSTLNPIPGFNPNYANQNSANLTQNNGIRLPVVNPKEIDVRSAALQRQYSVNRQDSGGFNLHDNSRKLIGGTNTNWSQISGDKKAFMSDLPPRFANQFKNQQGWQPMGREQNFGTNSNQEPNFNPYSSNETNSNFNTTNSTMPSANPDVMNTWDAGMEYSQPPFNWWQNPNLGLSNFDRNFPSSSLQPNYFVQQMSNNSSNPYLASQSLSGEYQGNSNYVGNSAPTDGNMPNQRVNLNYLAGNVGNLQNMMSTYGNFGHYNQSSQGQSQTYDTAMYPQFTGPKMGLDGDTNKGMPMGQFGSQRKDMERSLDSGGADFTGRSPLINRDRPVPASIPEGGNMYSLFAGGVPGGGGGSPSWGGGGPASHAHTQQSLWSGPGPSPLERLLEQQKQMKQPNE